MRLRTIALALALACGLTVSLEAARKNVIHPAAKSHRVKRPKHRKLRAAHKGKYRKPLAKAKHR
jgi:hypothetical protein